MKLQTLFKVAGFFGIGYYIEKMNMLRGKAITGVDDEALQIIMCHDYPGNIRKINRLIIDLSEIDGRTKRPNRMRTTYINLLTEEEGDDRIHAAYGKNYERLVEVKTRWDPENMFRMNKNIVPRAT